MIVRPETDQRLPHSGIVGDNYTTVLGANDTNGRYCVTDMFLAPGGSPPTHRHAFKESFTIFEGEVEFTFRGEKSLVRAGETISIPANAPHSLLNASGQNARMLSVAAPAGIEEFFETVGVPLATRTTLPIKPDQAAKTAFQAKCEELGLKYRMEFSKD